VVRLQEPRPHERHNPRSARGDQQQPRHIPHGSQTPIDFHHPAQYHGRHRVHRNELHVPDEERIRTDRQVIIHNRCYAFRHQDHWRVTPPESNQRGQRKPCVWVPRADFSPDLKRDRRSIHQYIHQNEARGDDQLSQLPSLFWSQSSLRSVWCPCPRWCRLRGITWGHKPPFASRLA
jgi:hypothetical protein